VTKFKRGDRVKLKTLWSGTIEGVVTETGVEGDHALPFTVQYQHPHSGKMLDFPCSEDEMEAL
jgi:hypothetical protein